MFSWLKKRFGPTKPEPRQFSDLPGAGENPANPGSVTYGNWTFDDGDRTWQEEMDVLGTFRQVLQEHGRAFEENDGVFVDTVSQLRLRPLCANLTPMHKQGARTETTVEFSHPARIPAPVFEFQHAAGVTVQDSLLAGFHKWYELDFVTILGALQPKSEDFMELTKVIADGRTRRITLGPVEHMAVDPAPYEGDEHPFCGCCLLTQSWEAFEPVIEGQGFQAIRLFASRDIDGVSQADCRVNGEDYPAGEAALIRYVERWPAAGFEYRKQYVVVQDD